VIVDSRAKPILVVPDGRERTIASARKLGIGTARSLSACLDILECATMARAQPDRLAEIAASVGWKNGKSERAGQRQAASWLVDCAHGR
jgi:hypothetical protein